MRNQWEIDRASFLDPGPRHGEVIGELVERRRRRLRRDEAGDADEREGQDDEWRTAALRCPDSRGRLSSTERSHTPKNPHDRDHHPWRDFQQRDQKTDRPENRIADDEVQRQIAVQPPREKPGADARQADRDRKENGDADTPNHQLDENEAIEENEQEIEGDENRDDAAHLSLS